MDGGLRAGAVEVVATLRRAGYDALWAGGCVRDMLMGLAPKDYDVATDATPEQVIALFDKTVAVGAQFGVVMVLLGGHDYEVATFRADLGYTDGRRPDGVRWASAREDVLRRDFTINGLLYDPLSEQLRDFVAGEEDLRRGVVRAIGDPEARFAEDRLRLLRAIRFSARFGFEIERFTWWAILKHAKEIGAVSAERIRTELQRMLSEGGAARGLTLLARSGLLHEVLWELPSAEAAVARFEGVGPVRPAVAWANALLDLPGMPGRMEALGRRLRLSRDLNREVGNAVTIAQALAAYDALDEPARKRLLRRPEVPTAFEVADRALAAGQLDAAPLAEARVDLARWSEADLRPARLLAGGDLIAAGHPPGPWFSEVLEAVETEQLAGRARTVEDAWAVVRRRRPGP